jgi:hypothetical protein
MRATSLVAPVAGGPRRCLEPAVETLQEARETGELLDVERRRVEIRDLSAGPRRGRHARQTWRVKALVEPSDQLPQRHNGVEMGRIQGPSRPRHEVELDPLQVAGGLLELLGCQLSRHTITPQGRQGAALALTA